MGKKKHDHATDKERILLYPLRELANLSWAEDFEYRHVGELKRERRLRSMGDPDSRMWASADNPKPGDLVIATTSGMFHTHPWVVGWYVENLRSGWGFGGVIRELGGDRLCNISNESFYVVKNVNPNDPQLLYGVQYKFYLKVRKAFAKADHYWYVFHRIAFPEPRLARISIRKKWQGAKPFTVDVPFKSKTTIKFIKETLESGGLGTREFEAEERLHA
jgi:hypothetical protein